MARLAASLVLVLWAACPEAQTPVEQMAPDGSADNTLIFSDSWPTDGRESDADSVSDTRAADAGAPTVYRISAKLVTDVSRGEFASLVDFAGHGPACFAGGEQVLLGSRERLVGRLRLAACAGASGEVLISSSQSTAPATISGSRTLADLGLAWQAVTNPTFNGHAIDYLVGTPLYRAGPIAQPVQQLYHRAARSTLARHPNRTAQGEPQYFHSTAFYEYSPTGCLAGACIGGDVSENPTWALQTFGLGPGAFAVIRTSNWSLQRSDIVWYSPTESAFAVKDSLSTAVTGNRPPEAGFGFILFNTLPLIDQPGEWYYHADEQSLYFWPEDGVQPAAAETEVSFTSEGSAISANFGGAALDLKVTDVTVVRAAASGVELFNARDLTVERTNIEQPEASGIVAWNLSGSARIEECTVADAASNGIHINQVAGTTHVAHVRLLRPGRLHNQIDLGMNFNGIRVGAQAELIVRDNEVLQAGYAGVMLGPSTVSLAVDDNTISGYCTLLNDCGGIYFNGTGNTLTANQEIVHNVLSGSVGNTSGVPAGWPAIAIGVYLDLGASHVAVRDNRVEQSHSDAGGIFLHGGNFNLISGNVVDAVFGPAFGMAKLAPSYPTMADDVVELNSFSTASVGYAVVRLIDPADHDCSDMQPAIKANNTLTHLASSGELFECL